MSNSDPIDSNSLKQLPFPLKLHSMLSNEDLNHIISWNDAGTCWRIHDSRAFCDEVVPLYFMKCKYSSFLRMACGWGFRRVLDLSSDHGSYASPYFIRSNPGLIKNMKREQSNNGRLSSSKKAYPDHLKAQIENSCQNTRGGGPTVHHHSSNQLQHMMMGSNLHSVGSMNGSYGGGGGPTNMNNMGVQPMPHYGYGNNNVPMYLNQHQHLCHQPVQMPDRMMPGYNRPLPVNMSGPQGPGYQQQQPVMMNQGSMYINSGYDPQPPVLSGDPSSNHAPNTYPALADAQGRNARHVSPNFNSV